MKRFERLNPWVWGIFAATAMIAAIVLFSYFRFENSDDILIVKSFMGFEGGVPADFNVNLHTFTSKALGIASRLVPGVAWFSLLELFCLWLSAAVNSKCAFELCPAGRKAFGAVISLLYLMVCAVFASARINFTTTAALLGAASVSQLCVFAASEKKSFWAAALSAALLLGCYLIRMQTLPAVIPFWLSALAYFIIKNKSRANIKRLAALVLACAALLGGSQAVREIELEKPELSSLNAFHRAYLKAMDYDPRILEEAPEEALAGIGWSKAELELVKQWYMMDKNITAEAFAALEAAQPEPAAFKEKALAALEHLKAFAGSGSRYAAAFALLAALCLLLALTGKGFMNVIASLMPLGAALALLFYLAYIGRIPNRAADCALFPAFALVLSLAAHNIDGLKGSYASKPKAALAACLILAALGASAYHAYDTVRLLSAHPDTVSAVREADLEAFALQNDDKLILRSPDLLRDTRVFPNVTGGIPKNIVIWGDWYCRTPSWLYQLESMGFDGLDFTASDFTSDRLLFAHCEPSPPKELTAYISEGCGREVVPYLFGARGELYFFGFR